ncbi:MAG TPA: DUF2269 family protein [Gaiellaceae bacterium]|nr:DUF2269 family protein [Gaiellaceae bacterium]
MYRWALFLHLAGAILFFAGLAVAAAGQSAARRRSRPSEIAVLLGTARWGVLGVALGTVTVVAFGFWLLDLTAHGFEGWVLASLALLVFALAAGAAGGQAPKRARRLASTLAGEEDLPSAELHALLHNRRSDALNWAAAVAATAILALMVWKPGA